MRNTYEPHQQTTTTEHQVLTYTRIRFKINDILLKFIKYFELKRYFNSVFIEKIH